MPTRGEHLWVSEKKRMDESHQIDRVHSSRLREILKKKKKEILQRFTDGVN